MPHGTFPIVLVFLGGGLGSVARYLIASAVERMHAAPAPADFPWATFAVNALGCAAIGLLAGWAATRDAWRFGLVLGCLGGFTTYSSFGLDTVRLIAAGVPAKAAVYVLATTFAGLGLAAAGFWATGAAARPPFLPE